MQKTTLFFLFLFAMLSVMSCNQTDKTKSDASLKSETKDNVLVNNSANDSVAFDKVIKDHDWAMNCIKNFQRIYGASNDSEIKFAHDTAIAYQLDSLIQWLNVVKKTSNADSILVRFAVYKDKPTIGLTRFEIEKISDKKLTVFLWPYAQGKPAIDTSSKFRKIYGSQTDPFDLGEIHPPTTK